MLAGEDGLKVCSKCKTPKDPAKDFGKHPDAKDGLQTACKRCYADYQAERRKDPAKKAADAKVKKRSTAKRKDYYQQIHGAARRLRRADPAARERELAWERAWRTPQRNASYNHARRARRLAAQVAGPVPPGTYAAVLASGPCVYCGAAATTVDHVTPLARGGHEAEYNLVPACGSCNSSKGAKLLPEWTTARVAHAVLCSEKVAAQLDLQLAA